jgi:hypothetical protein
MAWWRRIGPWVVPVRHPDAAASRRVIPLDACYPWNVAPPEQVTLRVLFDGPAPSLVAHRLSIGAFADPLKQLLRAFRRIASGLVSDALGDPGYGRRGGRYTKEAESLDLAIAHLGEGCVSRFGSCPRSPCLP